MLGLKKNKINQKKYNKKKQMIKRLKMPISLNKNFLKSKIKLDQSKRKDIQQSVEQNIQQPDP
ncbi:hypothetical protein ACO2FA_13420 [Staphylococcus warneri]